MATWLDATAFLERGCGALHPEELVHGEDFSLYEAMLAIQIGDTKMDIGLRREQGPSLAEELASGHAPLALSLATLEQLGMQLMQAEATWHLGSMLPTTVFSSLYMLDIPRCRQDSEGWGKGFTHSRPPPHRRCHSRRTFAAHTLVPTGS